MSRDFLIGAKACRPCGVKWTWFLSGVKAMSTAPAFRVLRLLSVLTSLLLCFPLVLVSPAAAQHGGGGGGGHSGGGGHFGGGHFGGGHSGGHASVHHSSESHTGGHFH